MTEAAQRSPCTLCKANAGKYVCPRCNAFYCGLDCYRSAAHASCSEEFYKECVREEMALDSNAEDSKSMQEILNRLYEGQAMEEDNMGESDADEEEFYEADSDDTVSDTDEDLAARLAGVDLDDADEVWQKLSKHEKEEFQRLLASGDTCQIVPDWQPWWNYKAAPVQELQSVDDFKKSCPTVKDIPALKDISKVSPAVRFGMSNVLLSYILVARHFRGDHLDPNLCYEAASCLMELSLNLGKGQNFDNRENAVAAVKLQATEVLGAPVEDIDLAISDLETAEAGPSPDEQFFYITSAFSDCISLLSAAAKKDLKRTAKGEFSKRFPTAAKRDKCWTKKEFNLAVKKIEFYIGWIGKFIGQ